MWIYKEPQKGEDFFKVGYYEIYSSGYGPHSKFIVLEEYTTRDLARDAVNYLNGG